MIFDPVAYRRLYPAKKLGKQEDRVYHIMIFLSPAMRVITMFADDLLELINRFSYSGITADIRPIINEVKTATGCWHLKADFDLALANNLVTLHRRQMLVNTGVIKRDVKRCLSRVSVGNSSFIVKEFCQPGPWGRWAADSRCWLNSRRLERLKLPVVPVYGWYHGRDGKGYVICQDLGTQHLHAVLSAAPIRLRRQFLAAAAQIIAGLHAAGVEHRDLKVNNFMVQLKEERSEVSDATLFEPQHIKLVDIDSARFYRRFRQDGIALELQVFLDSLPTQVEACDRLFFLGSYRRKIGISRKEFRGILAKLQ